jgi:hypothetical protein
MLKFLRKYRQSLLVVAGVMLMIAFLVPGAIQEWGRQRANVTVMKIGQRKVSAKEHHELTMEYEVLARLAGGTLPMFGITEGPEQWILLAELAERGGYTGAPTDGDDVMTDLGRTRGMMRLRAQYGDQLFNSLMGNPQFAGMLQGEIDNDIIATKQNYDRVRGEARLTEDQMHMAFARFRGIQRYIQAYTGIARVSTPRALIRGERELEGAQVEYIFFPADTRLADIGEPDAAALDALLTKYKDTRPGQGEYGLGYLLPPRVKLEYIVLDYAKIAAKVTPDLMEVRRRFNENPPAGKSFDEARGGIEATVRNEVVERVMNAAAEFIRTRVSLATRTLAEDGQFKALPADWESKRPKLSAMPEEIAKYVLEKTSVGGKPGVRIDPPEVVVRDDAYLTNDELDKLEGIGRSSLTRGQRQFPFSDYALAVHELVPTTPLTLQVGIPADEGTHGPDGSRYFFTILDARVESAPKSVDEVRARLTSDWKRIQAYRLLADQDAAALRAKAVAEGLMSIDETRKTPVEPGKAPPPGKVKSTRVTRTVVGNGDPDINTDSFRVATIDVAEKLDPLVSADTYPADARTFSVPLPEKLGIAIVRIRSLVPLTVEDFRARQMALSNSIQLDEFRSLDGNPLSVDRLKQRLNVRYIGTDGEERTEKHKEG